LSDSEKEITQLSNELLRLFHGVRLFSYHVAGYQSD
jgi:hypothetical protein